MSGSFDITGGTGEFKGATGNGLLAVVADPVASTAKLDLSGVVTDH